MRALPPLVLAVGLLWSAACSSAEDPSGEGVDAAVVEETGGPAGGAPGAASLDRSGELRVVVRDEDARPLAEVTARAHRKATGRVLAEAVTDAEGVAVFELPAGTYEIALAVPGEAKAATKVLAGRSGDLPFTLSARADADVALVVEARADGAPIADAEVRLLDLPSFAVEATATARGDVAGVVHLRVPSAMPLVAAVSAPGMGEARVAIHGAEAGADPTVVRLSPAAELHGWLSDPSGAPVAGVAVAALVAPRELFAAGENVEGDAFDLEVLEEVETGTDGSFLMSLPARVGIVLQARADESAGRRRNSLGVVRLEPGERAERDLVLRVGTRVEGVLFDPDGAPAPGVAVWLVRGGARRVFTRFEEITARAVTDADGRFVFPGVEPGSWCIGPAPRRSDASAIAAVPELLEVVAGLPRVEVELRPPTSLFLAGRCVDAAGEPVAGVGLVASSETQVASGTSAADGTFRLGPLIDGELLLRTTTGPAVAPGPPLAVRAGDAELVLPVVRAGSVRGRIVTSDGSAPPRAQVRLAPTDLGIAASVRSLESELDGGFHIADAVPGGYALIARAAPNLVGVERLEVGSADATAAELLLTPGAEARCRLTEAHANLSYVVLAGTLPVERGRVGGRLDLITKSFPAGDVAVELYRGSTLVDRRTGTASAGRSVDLSFLR